MRRMFARLAFIHRRLWMRDATYRAAFLAGPPPLLGIVVATVVWFGVRASLGPVQPEAAPNPPWAQHTPPVVEATTGPPINVMPDAILPAIGENGMPNGLTTGWQEHILPITVSAAFDVNVLPTPVAAFVLNQTDIDLDRIVAAGPQGGLFVGEQSAVLAIRSAGVHALSIRTDRSSERSADCLQRLAFTHRRLVSNLRLNISGSFSHTYDPIEFDLQPGLYRIAVVFGCWSGRQAVGPGRLTLLIRHPGDQALIPARADELLHPISKD